MSENPQIIEELDPHTAQRIANAPLPTKKTLFLRRFVPWQLVRFAIFNIRTLDIVRRTK
ncbi:MAG: hypothetical protein Q4P06_04440 [Actinomycetaceae bacterium]|nr:hypothetical protein [Actinomycetaceae bacterium]